MQSSKITTKGQVTIPQKLRRLLGVRPGDRILFEASGEGKILIRKIDGRFSLAGLLRDRITKRATNKEINDAIKHGWVDSGGD